MDKRKKKNIKMSLIIIYYVEIYKSKWKKTIIENIKNILNN